MILSYRTHISPAGVEFDPPKGRCWAYNQEKMLREIAEHNIWFGLEGRNTPRIKKFLANAKIGLTPETLWSGDNYGTTDSAKKHLLSLFPEMENVFDTPKPEELIKQIIEIASNEGEYVLDCYIGSGTTMATAHKLNRNYIGIEIGEQMTDLVVRRMDLVINGENGGISAEVNWQGGGEFVMYNFDKNKVEECKIKVEPVSHRQPVQYHQLDLFDLFEQYGEDPLVQNSMVREDIEIEYGVNELIISYRLPPPRTSLSVTSRRTTGSSTLMVQQRFTTQVKSSRLRSRSTSSITSCRTS